jgi:hypothetical protein
MALGLQVVWNTRDGFCPAMFPHLWTYPIYNLLEDLLAINFHQFRRIGHEYL